MPQYAIAIDDAEAGHLLEAAIDFVGGNHAIITGAAGHVIKVYRMFVIASGPTTVTFADGANALAVMPFNTNQGMVWDFDTKPWFTLTASNSFMVGSSAAVQVSGRCYYTL